MPKDAGRNSPVDEEHDWEPGTWDCTGRTGDVQVQALELVLLGGRLLGDEVLGETKELFFVAQRRHGWLRTYRAL